MTAKASKALDDGVAALNDGIELARQYIGLFWWVIGLLIIFFGYRFEGTVLLLEAGMVMDLDAVFTKWSEAKHFTPDNITALFVPFVLAVWTLMYCLLTSPSFKSMFQGVVSMWLIAMSALNLFDYFPAACHDEVVNSTHPRHAYADPKQTPSCDADRWMRWCVTLAGMFLFGVMPTIIAKCCKALSPSSRMGGCAKHTIDFSASLNFATFGAFLTFLSVASISDLAAMAGVSKEQAGLVEVTVKKYQLLVQGGLILVGLVWNYSLAKWNTWKISGDGQADAQGCKRCCCGCMSCCDKVSGILTWPLHIVNWLCVTKCCGPSVADLEWAAQEMNADQLKGEHTCCPAFQRSDAAYANTNDNVTLNGELQYDEKPVTADNNL